MATVRQGSQPVMVVVDVQVGVVDGAWEAPRVVGNVALAVQRAREQGVPVIWVQHNDNELVRDSNEWQWVPELVPAEGDVRIHKNFNSSFEATGLDAELARLGATHITLAGCATNWCIRATAYGALERGYDLTLVNDAHTTKSMNLGNGNTLEAARVIDDLNIAMTWLEYPGRITGTAKASELDFSKPVNAR
ncbi:cysteine hydrolase family protein [Caenimonas koreensis]|uniref:Isochorismatase family protein n=1 Tax=Caenimonas koreensis DSM 17982 TaxID=1121255 RepID=A0A844AZZ1_9BURK|nr:cysteine hydrolase [Caenimonas koreensis]MRD48008.1 isochorismatase family protein [Caenimonas koreensis DSM 17982]